MPSLNAQDVAYYYKAVKSKREKLLEQKNLAELFKQLPQIIEDALTIDVDELNETLKQESCIKFENVLSPLINPMTDSHIEIQLAAEQIKVLRYIYLVMLFNFFGEKIDKKAEVNPQGKRAEIYRSCLALLYLRSGEINNIIKNKDYFEPNITNIIEAKLDKANRYLNNLSNFFLTITFFSFVIIFINKVDHLRNQHYLPIATLENMLDNYIPSTVKCALILSMLIGLTFLTHSLEKNESLVKSLIIHSLNDNADIMPTIPTEAMKLYLTPKIKILGQK